MKIFLDTASVNELREGVAMGLVDGCTTNPSLIAKEKRPFRPLVEEVRMLLEQSLQFLRRHQFDAAVGRLRPRRRPQGKAGEQQAKGEWKARHGPDSSSPYSIRVPKTVPCATRPSGAASRCCPPSQRCSL